MFAAENHVLRYCRYRTSCLEIVLTSKFDARILYPKNSINIRQGYVILKQKDLLFMSVNKCHRQQMILFNKMIFS